MAKKKASRRTVRARKGNRIVEASLSLQGEIAEHFEKVAKLADVDMNTAVQVTLALAAYFSDHGESSPLAEPRDSSAQGPPAIEEQPKFNLVFALDHGQAYRYAKSKNWQGAEWAPVFDMSQVEGISPKNTSVHCIGNWRQRTGAVDIHAHLRSRFTAHHVPFNITTGAI